MTNEFDPKECAAAVVRRGHMCAGCYSSGVCGVSKLWNDYQNRCYFYDICGLRGDNLVDNRAVCDAHAVGVLLSNIPGLKTEIDSVIQEVESYGEDEEIARYEHMHDPAYIREVRFGTEGY
jgi:hypothetical protein